MAQARQYGGRVYDPLDVAGRIHADVGEKEMGDRAQLPHRNPLALEIPDRPERPRATTSMQPTWIPASTTPARPVSSAMASGGEKFRLQSASPAASFRELSTPGMAGT